MKALRWTVFIALCAGAVWLWLSREQVFIPLKDRVWAIAPRAEPLLPEGLTVTRRLMRVSHSALWSACALSVWRLSDASAARVRDEGLVFLATLDLETAKNTRVHARADAIWRASTLFATSRHGLCGGGRATKKIEDFKWSRRGEPMFIIDTGGESGTFFAVFPERGEIARLDGVG